MFEPVFTEWLLLNLPMSKDEAINSGAFVAGCNPYTCVRYLKKLVSAAGPLREFKDGLGIVSIGFKSDLKEYPSSSPKPNKQRGHVATSDIIPEIRRKERDGRVTGPEK